RHAHQIADHQALIFYVLLFLAALNLKQWRLGDVDVAALNQLGHLAIEESKQQGSDVRTVDVGVGHQDYLVIAEFGSVKIFLANAGSEGGDQRLDLAVTKHLVKARFFHVENLALERKDRDRKSVV